jgi:predicted ester cyclase
MKSVWISSLMVLAICGAALGAELQVKPIGRTGPENSRIVLTPTVRAIVTADSPEGRLARAWVRYVQGLVGEGGVQIEDVVTGDVRCIELEAAGYPPGVAGLKLFRQQINVALPDERVLVTQIRFSGESTIETELNVTGTHLGELMGRAPTGRSVRFVIHTLGRFKGDRLAERWDRMDFAGLLRQLGDGPK